MRAARSRQIRLDVREIEFEHVAKDRIRRTVRAEHPLRFRIGFDERDLLRAPPRELEIRERLLVDRKDRDRRPVFGRHVADRHPVAHAQARKAGAEKLDELADDAFLAQLLGNGQHQIGRGHAFAQASGDAKADHFGNQHRHRLTEHRRFGFDPTHAPGQDAEAVGHRRVRVRADDRVGIGDRVAVRGAGRAARAEHDAREIFDVDLMHDPGVGRHRAEVVERVLAPFEKGVALDVALELEPRVLFERAGFAEAVDLHRVIDHQFDRLQRVDRLRVAAHVGHRVAHSGQVDDGRNAGEVLQQHAGRPVRDLALAADLRVPTRQGCDVVLTDAASVFEAQQILQQDLQTERQTRDVHARFLERGEPKDRVRTLADGQAGAGFEAVRMRVLHSRGGFVIRVRRSFPKRRVRLLDYPNSCR